MNPQFAAYIWKTIGFATITMKLYVGNLSFDITERTLRELFEPFGTVSEVKLIMDRETGQSRAALGSLRWAMSRKVTRQSRASMERIRAAANSRLMRLAQKMIVAGALLLDRVATNSDLHHLAPLRSSNFGVCPTKVRKVPQDFCQQ